MILTISIYENEMFPLILDLISINKSYLIFSIKVLYVWLNLLIPPGILGLIVNGMFILKN